MLSSKETYTSPISGQVYDSYFQYLTSENEVPEERTEGKGTKAILGVDTEVNSQKSPFFDVGIKTTNLGTREQDVTTERELAARQVVMPTDNSPTSYPITETPSAPATDAKADIERRKKEIEIEGYKFYKIDNTYDIEDKNEGIVAERINSLEEAVIIAEKLATLKLIGQDEDGTWGSGLEYSFEGNTKQEVIDKINARYDAELAALGQPAPQVPATIQAAPKVSDEEKVIEITGAEDTSGIFELFGAPVAPEVAEDVNSESGVPSFLDKYETAEGTIDPRNVEDWADMAARNKAQAEELKNKCKGK